MTTDERRARAILGQQGVNWDELKPHTKATWLAAARAIRESDEAAGLALVPREATKEMLTEGVWDISPWHPAYDTEEGRKAAMRDAWNGMIAAATETPNE